MKWFKIDFLERFFMKTNYFGSNKGILFYFIYFCTAQLKIITATTKTEIKNRV